MDRSVARIAAIPELTDEELVARIRRGDRPAETAFIAKYEKGLLVVIRNYLPEHVEDIKQEAFRIVIERVRARGLEEPSKLSRYLLRTAKNLVYATLRDLDRHPPEIGATRIYDIVDTAPAPDQSLARDELAEVVRQVLAELPTQRDREILLAFYIHEKDKSQVCTELNLDGLHFYRVLHRARKRFRELLEARTSRQRGYPLETR